MGITRNLWIIERFNWQVENIGIFEQKCVFRIWLKQWKNVFVLNYVYFSFASAYCVPTKINGEDDKAIKRYSKRINDCLRFSRLCLIPPSSHPNRWLQSGHRKWISATLGKVETFSNTATLLIHVICLHWIDGIFITKRKKCCFQLQSVRPALRLEPEQKGLTKAVYSTY